MNPLIPTEAMQIRYESPIYEPMYDDDDNVIDEDCVHPGTDVWHEFVLPVHADGIPRYYRLRYRHNAKDHKKRWNKSILNVLTSDDPCFVKVSVIGRRVLFTYDPKLSMQRDKLLKRQEFLAKKRKRIQEQRAAQLDAALSNITWEVESEEAFDHQPDINYEDYYDDMEQQHVEQEEERLRQVAREIETSNEFI